MSGYGPSDIVGCCGHPVGRHGKDGCEVGWEWDASGTSVAEGCECEMRAPKGVAE